MPRPPVRSLSRRLCIKSLLAMYAKMRVRFKFQAGKALTTGAKPLILILPSGIRFSRMFSFATCKILSSVSASGIAWNSRRLIFNCNRVFHNSKVVVIHGIFNPISFVGLNLLLLMANNFE